MSKAAPLERKQSGRPPNTARLLLAAAAALLLGLFGFIAVGQALLEDARKSTETVLWTIHSEPSQAVVFDAIGQSLGVTPLQYTLPRQARIESLSLRKDGYAEQRISIDGSRDGDRRVQLLPLPKSLRRKGDKSP